MNANRPAVSRDTRLLLVIILISLGTLWVLARIRFPDRVPTPNPVPPVLAQLTPPSAFDDIATTVAQLEPRLQPWIVPLDVERSSRGNPQGATRTTVSGLRFNDDLVLSLIDPSPVTDGEEPSVIGGTEIGRDWASQLVVIRTPGDPAPSLTMWSPRRPAYPRFLIAASASHSGPTLRPVYVGSMNEASSPIWGGSVWTLPVPFDVTPGTFLFTVDGSLAGLVVSRNSRPTLVAGETLLALAERIAREGQKRRGRLGIEVQPMSLAIAQAANASVGVVVTSVDRDGPAAGQIGAADIIEALDGDPMTSIDQWLARAARVTADQAVVLKVRHDDQVRDVRITATDMTAVVDPSSSRRSLGLALRSVPDVGAVITRVDSGSAAARAGFIPGDVLTVVGGVEAPTASKAMRAFAAASTARPIVIAFTRGEVHRVVALERTW